MKKKTIIIIFLFFISAIFIGNKYYTAKEALPNKISNLIVYDYTLSKKQKNKSLQDTADYFFLLSFENEDFELQKKILEEKNYKTYSKDNLIDFNARFSSFKNNEIYEKVSSGDYFENYYVEDREIFIVFFILNENQIAIFYS